jgi:DNA invertase Pin-like site-specific DNA recombinase
MRILVIAPGQETTVFGPRESVARSLIAERVRAGLRNARAKGKRLGRSRKIADARAIIRLRAEGASWRTISAALGVSTATAFNAVSKKRLENPTSGSPASN